MDVPENTGREQGTGRFAPGQSGNPAGRPRGARNRATQAAEAILSGEAEALTRKAVELALAGDVTALRLCLERILPAQRGRTLEFDNIPALRSPADIVAATAELVAAIGAAEITPDEALTIGRVLDGHRRAFETEQLEDRLTALEQDVGRNE
ncbi:MAG: hypothetical protein IH905_12580 [Proteobacteria bacterium]|nr:hypothetical protein [Pseudomonadota bacterium]